MVLNVLPPSLPLARASSERPLLPAQEEVVVMQRPQLCQSAQQAPKPLWSPSRSSTLGPTNLGQQVEDQLLHFFYAVGGLKGGSVCGEVAGGGIEMVKGREIQGLVSVRAAMKTVIEINTRVLVVAWIGIAVRIGRIMLELELGLVIKSVLEFGLGLIWD